MKKDRCKRGHERTPENLNGTGCKICQKKWLQVHRVENRKYQHRMNRTLGGQFTKLKCTAKRRGFEVTLSFDEFKALRELPCHYCGGLLPDAGVGVDRIHSSIGYVQGNVRPCCTQCNSAKSDYTETEFRDWILRAYKHWASQ